MKNLGILLSGRGSNFEAIAKNVAGGKIPDARIAVVISNKPDAGGLEVAKRMGLDTLVIPSRGKPREQHDREVVTTLQQRKVDLVCLAGYMRLLSPWFVQQFPRRILNIHPSLLPSFPGLEAQPYDATLPDSAWDLVNDGLAERLGTMTFTPLETGIDRMIAEMQ